MAKRVRNAETASLDIGGIAGGLGGETAAEPDSPTGGTEQSTTEQFTDPASVGADGSGAGEQPRRGRGRPRGSGTKTKTETGRSLGVEGVAGILLTIHSTLAVIARTPELELSEDEAAKIARASVNVAKLYNIETTEKATAWANLIGVVGAAYVPRFISVSIRRKMEADERRGGNVTQFPGSVTGQQPNLNGGMRPN